MGKYDDLFDEGTPSPTPSPGGGGKYSDLFDEPSSGAAPSPTPDTDKAASESVDTSVSQPAWMRQRASAENLAKLNEWFEKSGHPIGGELPKFDLAPEGTPLTAMGTIAETGKGYWNTIAGISDFLTSPRGIAEAGVAAATGGMAALPLLGAEIAPQLPEQAVQTWKAATGQLPPGESAQAGANLALLLAPGAHAIGRRGAPPPFRPFVPPPEMRATGPLPFEPGAMPPPPVERLPVPEALQIKPTAETRDYTPGGGEEIASEITSPEGLPSRPLREGVDAGAPLPEQREAPEVRTQPVAPSEAVAPTVPEGEYAPGEPVSPYFIEKHGDVFAIVDRRNPSDVGFITPDLKAAEERKSVLDSEFLKLAAEEATKQAVAPVPAKEPTEEIPVVDRIQQLTADIATMREQGVPVPISKTMELRQLKEGAPPPLVPAVDPRIAQLQRNAADLKNDVGDYLGKKPTPEEAELQKRLWATYDRIHLLREKSGEPRDMVIIGGGAGGLKAAAHGAYEGLDTVVLEREKTTGGQAKHSQEIVNVGAEGLGVTGHDYFTPRYLTARNRGAQIKTGVEVANLIPRADGGIDVVTKKHGVIPAKRVAILTGSSGNIHPNMELAGWHNAKRLSNLTRGKTGIVYGAGNSATQAVFGAIRNGAKKITIVSRHKFGPEVSEDQRSRINDLVKKGKVELVTGSVANIARDPATGGVKVRVGNRDIPAAHIENFLDTSFNTGWLPEGIEKVPLKSGKPGPVKVLGPSLKTTMPGVYVGGDIAAPLPGQRGKGRRIDIAEGEGAEIATSVHHDIAHWQQTGKFPEWIEREPTTPEGIDQHLKALKGLKEAPPTPSTGGTPTIPSPTKKEPTSTTTLSGSAGGMPSRTPPTAPAATRPRAAERDYTPGQPGAAGPADRFAGIPASSRAIAEGRRATMYGGEGHQDYVPGEDVRPPVQTKPIPGTPDKEALGWEEATDHGRKWLDSGGNINQVVADYRKNMRINSWDMGKLQAHMERLQNLTNEAGDALRKNPNNAALKKAFNDAKAREDQFQNIYGSAKTQASHTLPLQGHVPVNEAQAASVTGLARRFNEIRGKPMTARDEMESRSIARKADEANKAYGKATGAMYKALEEEYGKIKTDRKAPPTDAEMRATFTQLKEVC